MYWYLIALICLVVAVVLLIRCVVLRKKAAQERLKPLFDCIIVIERCTLSAPVIIGHCGSQSSYRIPHGHIEFLEIGRSQSGRPPCSYRKTSPLESQ